jgi:transposase InsO family protein
MSSPERAPVAAEVEVVPKASRRRFTKLRGPATWTYFYLYVMLDVFSRYVVGWMVAPQESATLAEQFMQETYSRQGIGRE